MFCAIRFTYSVITGSFTNLSELSIIWEYSRPIRISPSREYQFPSPRPPPMSRFPMASRSSLLPGLTLGCFSVRCEGASCGSLPERAKSQDEPPMRRTAANVNRAAFGFIVHLLHDLGINVNPDRNLQGQLFSQHRRLTPQWSTRFSASRVPGTDEERDCCKSLLSCGRKQRKGMPTERQQRRPRLSASCCPECPHSRQQGLCGDAMSDALDVGGPILLTLPTYRSDSDVLNICFVRLGTRQQLARPVRAAREEQSLQTGSVGDHRWRIRTRIRIGWIFIEKLF